MYRYLRLKKGVITMGSWEPVVANRASEADGLKSEIWEKERK